jgi:hypothetical protein
MENLSTEEREQGYDIREETLPNGGKKYFLVKKWMKDTITNDRAKHKKGNYFLLS